MSPAERAEHATFGDRFAYFPDGGTKAYEGQEDVLDALLAGVLSRRVRAPSSYGSFSQGLGASERPGAGPGPDAGIIKR